MKTQVGFCGLLTLLFIGLKLTHYIDWSWWWVLLPAYFWFAFIALLVTLVFIFAGFVDLIDSLTSGYNKKIARAAKEYHREVRSMHKKSKWGERLEELQKQSNIKQQK